MARISRGSSGTSSSTSVRVPNPNASSVMPDGQVYDAPDDSSNFTGSVADRVRNSQAYKDAFNLFVTLSDKSWLQRLQAIPTSVGDAKETWTDQIGLTNNYHDKQNSNYQYCIEQINALVAEYQSWKNSLPVTQVEQLNEAGINAAVTGQGVNGSSIPNVGVSSDPSALQSANPADFIFSAVDRFLSLSSGTLDWIDKFNQISLNNKRFEFDTDSAWSDFVYSLSKDGITLDSSIGSFADLLKSDDNSWLDSASSRSKRLFNQFKEIQAMDAYGNHIIHRTVQGDYRSGDFYSYDKDGKLVTRFGSPVGASIDVDHYSKTLSDFQYNLFLNELKYKSRYAEERVKYHEENGYTNVEDTEYFNSISAALESETKRYERDKAKIYIDYIKQLKSEADSGNIASRIQLMDALYELNNTSMLSDLGDELVELVKSLLE